MLDSLPKKANMKNFNQVFRCFFGPHPFCDLAVKAIARKSGQQVAETCDCIERICFSPLTFEVMSIKFIGYADGGEGSNPDGSLIYEGQPIYSTTQWGIVDGCFLQSQGIDPSNPAY